MDDVYSSALISMETRLRDCLSMVGVVSRLERPAGGFLSWDERRLVESIPFEPDRISKLVELLRKKSNDDFHRFCRILDQTGNEHLSRELKQKTVDFSECERTPHNQGFDQRSFLKKFYHEIKTDMDARHIALELYLDEAIPEGVKIDIQNAKDARSANLLLYDHLLNQASLSTLTNVCDVMSEVEGMDRMKSLGRRMKDELQQYNSSRDSS